MKFLIGLNLLIESNGSLLLESVLNSIWQGVLLALVLWCCLRAGRQLNAASRYVIWCGALGVLVLIPAIRFGITAGDVASGPEMPRDAFGVIQSTVSAAGSDMAELVVPPGASSEPQRLGKYEPALAHTASSRRLYWLSMLAPSRSSTLILLGVWFTGSGLLLLRISRGYFHLRKLKANCQPLEQPLDVQHWKTLCATNRSIQLGSSTEIISPVAAGFRHPKILIPKSLIDAVSPPELEQLLLHEFAHLKRWDDWTNLGQQIATAILFFHPAAWFVSRQMHLEREIACDDLVISRTSNPKQYALCLTTLADRSPPSVSPCELTAGAWLKPKYLSRRINMILQKKRNTTSRCSALATGVALAGITGVLAIFSMTRPLLALAAPSAPPTRAEASESNDAIANRDQIALPNNAQAGTSLETSEPQSREPLEDKLQVARDELQELLTRYSQKHPRVVQALTKIRNLERLSANPNGAHFTERELIEEEIKLVEQMLEVTKRKHEAGRASEMDLWQLQREILKLKRAAAALDNRPRPDLLDVPIPAVTANPPLTPNERNTVIDQLTATAKSDSQPAAVRRKAIRSLAEFQSPPIIQLLTELFHQPALKDDVVGALHAIRTDASTKALLALYLDPANADLFAAEGARTKADLASVLAARLPAASGETRQQLFETLVQISVNDPDPNVRSHILGQLASLAARTRVEAKEGKVTVLGAVEEPGVYPIAPDGRSTIVDAVALAGGFNKLANKRRVTLIHGGAIQTFNFDDYLKSPDSQKLPKIQDGDQVVVHETFF